MASPVQASGNISSLLRLIQEQRSNSPAAINPTGDPGAPIRQSVQAPLEAPISPESPGSDRVIALRPEGDDGIVPGGIPDAPIAPGRARVGAIGGPGQVVDPLGFNPAVEGGDPNVIPAAEPPAVFDAEGMPDGAQGDPQGMPFRDPQEPTPGNSPVAPASPRPLATRIAPRISTNVPSDGNVMGDVLGLTSQTDQLYQSAMTPIQNTMSKEEKDAIVRKNLQERVQRAAAEQRAQQQATRDAGIRPNPSLSQPPPIQDPRQNAFTRFFGGLGTRLRNLF